MKPEPKNKDAKQVRPQGEEPIPVQSEDKDEFRRSVERIIERYRPALEELAK